MHGAKRGSAKYKRLLESTTQYEILEISSESSMSEGSDSSYDDKKWTKQIKRKRKNGPSLFESVYPSDQEETEYPEGTKLSMKKKVVK